MPVTGWLHSHRLHRRYCCLFLGRSGLDDYIPAAVPSGAAQEARYPAGTLGDIQAVTATDSFTDSDYRDVTVP